MYSIVSQGLIEHFYEVHQVVFEASSILLRGLLYHQFHYRYLYQSSSLLLGPRAIFLGGQVSSYSFFDEESLANLSIDLIHLLMSFSLKQVYLRHHRFLYRSSFLILLAYNQIENGDFDHSGRIYGKRLNSSWHGNWFLFKFSGNLIILLGLSLHFGLLQDSFQLLNFWTLYWHNFIFSEQMII